MTEILPGRVLLIFGVDNVDVVLDVEVVLVGVGVDNVVKVDLL